MQRLFTNENNFRDPNAEPNFGALQTSLDLQQEMGIQKTRIDIQKYADVGIVHEAAARLK